MLKTVAFCLVFATAPLMASSKPRSCSQSEYDQLQSGLETAHNISFVASSAAIGGFVFDKSVGGTLVLTYATLASGVVLSGWMLAPGYCTVVNGVSENYGAETGLKIASSEEERAANRQRARRWRRQAIVANALTTGALAALARDPAPRWIAVGATLVNASLPLFYFDHFFLDRDQVQAGIWMTPMPDGALGNFALQF